jgi:FkbM family methyltransferase
MNAFMTKAKPIFKNGNITIKHCKHGYFAYNQFDEMVGNSLDTYGEWCEQEFDLFKEVIEAGNVILDVGAYIGTHTVFFAKQVGSLGKVLAFEPQRSSFQLLCTNLTLNALYNTQCLQVGVGEVSKSLKLPVADPYEGRNYGAISIEGYQQGEDLQLITIDSLKIRQCDLIKVDVEGMEAKVLEGAKNTIMQFRPILYVENNNVGKSYRLLQVIKDLKYDCWWHFVPYFNLKNFFKSKEDIFTTCKRPFEANLICLPQEQKARPKNLLPVSGLDDNWEKAWQYKRYLKCGDLSPLS